MAADSNPNEVQIDSVRYPVYANVAAADTFMKSTLNTAWDAQNAETKCVILIGVTRGLDSLDWLPSF